MKCYSYWTSNYQLSSLMKIFFLSTVCLLFMPFDRSYAEEYGVVTDLDGKALIIHDGKRNNADLGMNILTGDSIVLEKNTSLVIVSYDRCEEWRFTGRDRIDINADQGPISQKRMLTPSRTLPVCYSPEEFQDEQMPIIGGFVLRGKPSDPVANLRKEFNKGNASNTVLMTLIMHDLSHGNMERAKPYYVLLKERIPNSSFVKTIAPRFE